MADAHSTHACQVCGTEVTRALTKSGEPRKATKYVVCSARCRDIARGKSQGWVASTIQCAECGKSFVQKSARNTMFCSKACGKHNWAKENPELYKAQQARHAARNAALKHGPIEVGRTPAWFVVKTEAAALKRIAANWKAGQKNSKQMPYGKCTECGTEFQRATKYQKVCSSACEVSRGQRIRKRKMLEKKHAKAVKRAACSGSKADKIDPIRVFERDKWRCHLCGKKTSIKLRGTHHKDAPELEHIVAIADGGTHTWGNVACACRECNIKKGARSFGQLGLQIAA